MGIDFADGMLMADFNTFPAGFAFACIENNVWSICMFLFIGHKA